MKVCICNNFNEARLNEVYADPTVLNAIQSEKAFQDKCDALYRAASGGEDPVCRSCFDVIEARIEDFISRHASREPAPASLPVVA